MIMTMRFQWRRWWWWCSSQLSAQQVKFLRQPTAVGQREVFFWCCAGYQQDNALLRFEPFLWKYWTPYLDKAPPIPDRGVKGSVWQGWLGASCAAPLTSESWIQDTKYCPIIAPPFGKSFVALFRPPFIFGIHLFDLFLDIWRYGRYVFLIIFHAGRSFCTIFSRTPSFALLHTGHWLQYNHTIQEDFVCLCLLVLWRGVMCYQDLIVCKQTLHIIFVRKRKPK